MLNVKNSNRYNLRQNVNQKFNTKARPQKQIPTNIKDQKLIRKLIQKMEIEGFHFKCPICNFQRFLKGLEVSNHLKNTHKLIKTDARTIKRNCKEQQIKLIFSASNDVIDLTNSNKSNVQSSNNCVQLITEIDMDLQIIEDLVETIDLTVDNEIFSVKKKTKLNSDQKDGKNQIINIEEKSDNVIDTTEKSGNGEMLNNEEKSDNITDTIEKYPDSINTIFNVIENPISSENIVQLDKKNQENKNLNGFPCNATIDILNEANIQISEENTSIIEIGCEKFHTVDEIHNSISALNLPLENIAEKEETNVTTSEQNTSNITLENDKNLGSENKGVTSAQINNTDEQIKVVDLKSTTVKTNNMIGTIKIAKKVPLIYRCKLCPGKLFKRILLAQEHLKNKHNKKKLRVVKRRNVVKETDNKFIHVKDILSDIEINKTVIETKIFNEKPFYLFGCCLCPHYVFFSLNEIFTHNRTYHDASRDLIAEMPVIPIKKLIQNDSKQSELVLGCLCDHIIFNKKLVNKEIINKTYKEILMERNLDCDLGSKLKVIYKYGIGNGYHMSFKVVIDPVAGYQDEISKENRIKEAKVVENVGLDASTLKNTEVLLSTNNIKTSHSAKRKNEENTLDWAKEIKKRYLDKVFSLPTDINTPTDLIEAKNPNTEEIMKENQMKVAKVVENVSLDTTTLKNTEEVLSTNNIKTSEINFVDELRLSNDKEKEIMKENQIKEAKVVENVSLDATTLKNTEEVLSTNNIKTSVTNSADELRLSNDKEKEIMKENQIKEPKVVENVSLDATTLKNTEEVLSTNNIKTSEINSVDELRLSNNKENSDKRKDEENSLDWAKEIKKRCLDKVFSLPTDINTPTDLIEAKNPNTEEIMKENQIKEPEVVENVSLNATTLKNTEEVLSTNNIKSSEINSVHELCLSNDKENSDKRKNEEISLDCAKQIIERCLDKVYSLPTDKNASTNLIEAKNPNTKEITKENQFKVTKVIENVSLDAATLKNAKEVLSTNNIKTSEINSVNYEVCLSNDKENSDKRKNEENLLDCAKQIIERCLDKVYSLPTDKNASTNLIEAKNPNTKEIMKENQSKEPKVVENVSLDATILKNTEEVLSTNNIKTSEINSVDELCLSNNKENSDKRKNEENSLDWAKEIKKRCLDKVFSMPTDINTPTDLIEAKDPNTDFSHTEASSSSSSEPNTMKIQTIGQEKYKYEPPILVGKWGRNQWPTFPKINCYFWPFENRRKQSSTNSNFWSF